MLNRRPRLDRTDDGSVLMLLPAAVFVVLVLAAITLDVGFVHVRAQEVRFAASSAANDALGALDADALRSTGTISFDQREAERLARAAVVSGPVPHADVEAVTVTRRSTERWEVSVTLGADVRYLIAPALPGASRRVRITTTERALLVLSSH